MPLHQSSSRCCASALYCGFFWNSTILLLFSWNRNLRYYTVLHVNQLSLSLLKCLRWSRWKRISCSPGCLISRRALAIHVNLCTGCRVQHCSYCRHLFSVKTMLSQQSTGLVYTSAPRDPTLLSAQLSIFRSRIVLIPRCLKTTLWRKFGVLYSAYREADGNGAL